MMDIKILVAAHKPYWMPDDDVYLPIQVGAAGKESLGWQRDDEGENISAKNPNYCELTALYWAWKNLEADYIGLCHYRRYFVLHTLSARMKEKRYRILHRQNYEQLLKQYDVILPKKQTVSIDGIKMSLYQHYEKSHHIEDLKRAKKILLMRYPEYKETFAQVMSQEYVYFCNMFVMPFQLFREYCSWLFSILFSLEKNIDITAYDVYQARIFGFLAERLFNVWLAQQNLKICEIPVAMIQDPPPKPKWYKQILYKMTERNNNR